MKKSLWILILSLFFLSFSAYAQTESHTCRLAASIVNDGSGDSITKKSGGNYAAILLDTLQDEDILTVTNTSGTLRYLTLHARYQNGVWKTIYTGPLTEFPVRTYLATYKKDPTCTHVIVSVNGAHEKYDPLACKANIRICSVRPESPSATVTPAPALRTRKVAFKTHNGHFLCAESGGGQALVANRSHAREWETFTLIPMPGDNKVALQAYNGQFVRAEGGGGRALIADRTTPGENETFTLVRMAGENSIALQTANGLYVCAENGGGGTVVANRPAASTWETFTLIPLE